jgi:hypothetical protein
MTLSVRAKGFILDRRCNFQKYEEGIKLGRVKVEIQSVVKAITWALLWEVVGRN